MARNQEKAQSMLNRFLEAKRSGFGSDSVKKHRDPIDYNSIPTIAEAEGLRTKILRKLGHKIEQIQNTSLGETQIRELNEEVNTLLGNKGVLEGRIKELGGKDHVRIAPRVTDIDGKSVQLPGSTFMYFGAARGLPDVKELLNATNSAIENGNDNDSISGSKRVVDDNSGTGIVMNDYYYGNEDDGDGLFVEMEGELEEKRREEAIQRYEVEHGELDDNDNEEEETEEDTSLPSEQDIRDRILLFKKRKLMDRFL